MAGSVNGFSRPFDALVAFSLANLCFLRVWRELLFASPSDAYWIPDYTHVTYLAVIINVSLLGVILFGILRYLVHSDHRWLAFLGRVAFLFTLVFPLSYFARVFNVNTLTVFWLKDHWLLAGPLAAIAAVVGGYVLAFRLSEVTRLVAMICLLLSPFAAMNLVQALSSTIALAISARPPPVTTLERLSSGAERQRVLWLLMDELDFRATFLDPPAGLALPEFDRLRREALFAEDTISYSLSTEEAIPSYLVQKIVQEARPLGPSDLRLNFMEFEQTPDADLSDIPTLFAQAAQREMRIAIVGYYHPYCRLFRKYASFCRDFRVDTYAPFATKDLLREMMSQFIGLTPMFTRANAITIYQEARTEINKLASDPQWDLIYMHASVPHGPNIWDRDRDNFTLFSLAKDGYFGNLMLADGLLGSVRSSMEAAGLWDKTVVLLTSDHEWRSSNLFDGQRMRKIPFLLKMPGQTLGMEFSPAFSPMRVTRDLLLEIFDGALVTPEAAARWLKSRSSEEPH